MDLLNLNWETLCVDFLEDERCGLVLTSGEIIELPNMSSYPSNSFVLSVRDVEPYKSMMVATWHTHPKGPNNLSIDDYNTFLDMPEIPHFIVTTRSVTMFQAEDDYVMNRGRRLLNGHD